MSQTPHKTSSLQLLVLAGEIIAGILLIIINISHLNIRLLSYGLFLVIFSGLQVLALQVEERNKQLTMQIRWLVIVVLVIFVVLIYLKYV